ncbi:butyrophilin-like protein 10 isoform X3 [Pseudochaenichthys georgianus]|uniref:butyrophilin-like protein 10 isoform X3 n=1 Tax=Pseudochaenichthys georgianus TaxID=52239 RepID=UPI001469F28A|nr:butyrophilin subfamily 1 member A1-like isoform X4 [Pseudochaenichthys georgianus]
MLADSLQFLFVIFYFLPTCSGITIGAVRVVVREGGEALFPVSINMSAERLLFDWKKVAPGGELLQEVFMYDNGVHYNNGRSGGQSPQFKGRVSHFPAELRHGNASIVIRNTTAADRGNYTCYFPRLQTPQTFYFELDVAATPKPSVTVLTATSDRALLRCEVPGASLNTRAEWQSGDGNRLEAEEERVPEEDHDHISLSVNVTRTDLYLCVVSQEDIKHRVSAQTFVHVCEKQKMECKECYSTAAMLIVGIVLVVLGAVLLAAVQALLVRGKRIKILHNNGSALREEEEIHTGNGFSNGTNGHVRVPLEEPLNSVQC